MAEVRQTLLSLKNSIAGWDDLPAVVSKQSIDSYIEPLACLINRSFSDDIFPDELARNWQESSQFLNQETVQF